MADGVGLDLVGEPDAESFPEQPVGFVAGVGRCVRPADARDPRVRRSSEKATQLVLDLCEVWIALVFANLLDASQ
jgi:hypothetical protein